MWGIEVLVVSSPVFSRGKGALNPPPLKCPLPKFKEKRRGGKSKKGGKVGRNEKKKGKWAKI